MAFINTKRQPSTITQTEIAPHQTARTGDIEFAETTSLYCYGRHPVRAGDDSQRNSVSGRWCDEDGTTKFLDELLQEPKITGQGQKEEHSYPSFTLIAGHGNGTLKPLSLGNGLLELIITRLRLGNRVRRMIRSIHGVFFSRVETKSLLIIFSPPKSPVREVFFAMRVRVVDKQYVVTCLLFDGELTDISRIVNRVSTSGTTSSLRNPLFFLTMLIDDIGCTSEEKRSDLDSKILNAELKTHSTSWGSTSKTTVRWPEDSYQTMSALHVCHNNLIFVARAVDVEIDAWQRVQKMAEDERLKRFWTVNNNKKVENEVLETIEFELAYTESRKAQILGLKERVEVQINLIHNMMAHQEASQTNLIAIVALVFAPASLIAGIFSAGIFETHDRSWVAYLASTLPITFVTVAVGLIFLEQHRLKRAWRFIYDLIAHERQPEQQEVV